MCFKTVCLISLFFLLCMAYGNNDPNSEIEYIKGKDSSETEKEKLKNQLKKNAEELSRLIDMLSEAKRSKADGPNSDTNIKNILAMPQIIANISAQLDSTIKLLENKELLAA